MEQPVWIFFGIISVLLALGIVGGLVYKHQNEVKYENFDSSLDKLVSQCNFVCQTNEGNMLGIDINLPTDSLFYTSKNKLCIRYEDKVSCKACNCDLSEYKLDLNTSLSKSFDNLNYRCYFEKLKSGVAVECRG